MNRDRDAKKQYVEDRWLRVASAVSDMHGYDQWFFIEIANNIRFVKNQLADKTGEMRVEMAVVG